MREAAAYQKILTSLKRRKNGATAADICASTALPLSVIEELLPKAADEYSGHLRVTESGEILYHFPNGFKNRYKGFAAAARRFFGKASIIIKNIFTFLFKVWIMVMLIGYFVLFIALTLAVIFLQIASKSNEKKGGFGLIGALWRIWFYSAITNTHPRYYGDYEYKKVNKEPKRPMHTAIFSFVFGEKDPNKNWDEEVNRAVISYLQANKGVITLVEYMAFSGESCIEAEQSILAFCSRYEGSPEVTEDGTIIYRFDKLLMKSEKDKFSELIPPVKKLKIFSANKKSMNAAFGIINTVNLLFGSYFLYQSITVGQIISAEQFQTVSTLYGSVNFLLGYLINQPHTIILPVLGIIPAAFSLIFWLIPALRYINLKKENEEIKTINFNRFSYNKIWSSPENIEENTLRQKIEEYKPKNFKTAFDKVIKNISAVFSPDIKITDDGKTIYSFNELKREKQALEKYRNSLDTANLQIGKKVFDSNE